MKNNKPVLVQRTKGDWNCRIRCEVAGMYIGWGRTWEEAMDSLINLYWGEIQDLNIPFSKWSPGFMACARIRKFTSTHGFDANVVVTAIIKDKEPVPVRVWPEPLVKLVEAPGHCKATSNLPWWKRLFRI